MPYTAATSWRVSCVDSENCASRALSCVSCSCMPSSRMGVPPVSVPSGPEKRAFHDLAKRSRPSGLHSTPSPREIQRLTQPPFLQTLLR